MLIKINNVIIVIVRLSMPKQAICLHNIISNISETMKYCTQ